MHRSCPRPNKPLLNLSQLRRSRESTTRTVALMTTIRERAFALKAKRKDLKETDARNGQSAG